MATWRVARSLDTLLGQLNAKAPKRSKLSDGSIGDAAHASRDSDHNPWLKSGGMGIVTARDFTNDPAGGLDCNWLASQLVASGDPRIKYVIWNRRIWTSKSGWIAYKGTNPHDHHLHLSVSDQPGWFDSTLPWSISGSTSPGTSPIDRLPPVPPAAPVQEDDMARFITAQGSGTPWFLTNGLTKRVITDGAEAQRLVDMGVATWHPDGAKVKVVGQWQVDRLPDAG